MARPVSSVHVDIARLIFEVSKVSSLSEDSAESMEKLGRWTKRLVECLATRNPDFHPYGATLLSEVDEYRKAEIERKKGNPSALSKDSKEGADSLLRTDRADQSRQIDLPLSPSRGLDVEFEKARKAFPGTRRAFGPEWDAFQKKHGKRAAEIVPLLLPAIGKYKAQVEKKARVENRPPIWQHFKTWLHQEAWTAEYPGESVTGDHDGKARAQAYYREHGYFPSSTPSAWMSP